MTPIIVKSRGPGWSIYMVPSHRQTLAHMIETQQPGGSVPKPIERVATVATKAEALSAIKQVRA